MSDSANAISPFRPFKCDSCEVSYKYAWDLTKHKKREHSQEAADEDWIKMETVEFREDDEHDVDPMQLPTRSVRMVDSSATLRQGHVRPAHSRISSSNRASTRKKRAVKQYEKSLPVKVDPDALMTDIVSIKNEVKTEPLETV